MQFLRGKSIITQSGPTCINLIGVNEAFPRSVKQTGKGAVHFSSHVQGRDNRECIIKDDMVLWGNVLAPRIIDEWSQGRVSWRKPHKDTLASTAAPFRNFFPSCKAGSRTKNRAAKDMSSGQTRARTLEA
jgi:hypothetical protein